MRRCNQPHRVKERREGALRRHKTTLAVYVSGAVGSSSSKKGKKRVRQLPPDLDQAIEYTKAQIAILEQKLGVKKIKVQVDDDADESAAV